PYYSRDRVHVCISLPFTVVSFFLSSTRPHPRPTLFPYTTLFRSHTSAGPTPWTRAGRRRDERRARHRRPSLASLAPHQPRPAREDRKSTRLNSSHVAISYAVFCLKKKKNKV